jgi:hypothetical protein
MDRTSLEPPDPASHPPYGERRRGVRQKLHTPVYVSFNGPQTGLVVDLSELLDINEYGFAVQTAVQGDDRLEASRPVSLCLDFPETKSYVHGSGRVIWSDESGRAGIRFSFLPEPAQRALRQWLFTNLLVASSNHASRTTQRENQELEGAGQESGALGLSSGAAAEQAIGHGVGEPANYLESVAENPGMAGAADKLQPWPQPQPALASDRAAHLSALDDLRNQIRTLDGNTEVILQIITEAARDFSGASGAALAFITDGVMICRARAGAPAPPIGATVDTKNGLSGECVRTGRSVLCADSESDSRVDAELCRALGLRSLLAVPIFADFRVAGLLEVFSLAPGAFSEDQEIILDRLVELIPSRTTPANSPEVSTLNGMTNARNQVSLGDETDNSRSTETGPDTIRSQFASNAAFPMNAVESSRSVREPLAPPISPVPSDSAKVEDTNFTARNIREAIWQQPPKLGTLVHSTSQASESATAIPAPKRLSPVDVPSRPPDKVPSTAVGDVRTRKTGSGKTKIEAPTVNLLPSALSRSKPRRGQIALLSSAIAVTALVLGYLLAPAVEKRFSNNPTQTPPTSAQAAVEATTLSRPSAHPSGTRLPLAMSLEDLRKLADEGVAEAQWRLGVLYHNGEGIPQSDTRAVEWFQRAAAQGYVPALSALGSHYWSGRGVQQDYAKAYFWFQLALAEGDEKSKPLLEGLATQMTEAQVANARQQAEAWLQAHNQLAKPAAN